MSKTQEHKDRTRMEEDHDPIDADADFKEVFSKDMLRMLKRGSTNDVKIILSDGEIRANKDVLIARCEYFAGIIRCKENAKDESNVIENTDCCKEVMERILKYLFTGSIRFKDLNLLQLLELGNQVRKLLLSESLLDLIMAFVKKVLDDILTKKEESQISVKDLILGLSYADKFALNDHRVKDLLNYCIILCGKIISNDNEVKSHFEKLNISLVKDIIKSGRNCINSPSWTKLAKRKANLAMFQILSSWYENEKNNDKCSKEDKEDILGCISLDLFLPSELIEIVKSTGLYPDDEIDKRIRDYLHEMDGIISTRERSVLA